MAIDSISSRSRCDCSVICALTIATPARPHGDPVAVVRQLIGQLLGVFLRVALAAADARDDQPGLAVLADQLGGGRRRRGPCRGHARDMR